MKAEKIDHIVIRVRDAQKAIDFFSDLFETRFDKLGEIAQLDIRSYMDPMGIEIVEGLTADGPTARATEKAGQGLSLLSIKVPDLDEAVAEMKARGIREVNRFSRGNMKAVLFHPKDTFDTMIELIEYTNKHGCVAAAEGQ
ncbi:MAG: VOC family protein [Chloroflexi bacterium]|nr:VOC family protein [Chloroflexota bacterium]